MGIPNPLTTARWACALLVVLATSGRSIADQAAFSRWYAVLLEDQPVGWMHTAVNQTLHPSHTKPSVATTTRMKISIRRGRSTVELSANSQFIETTDGEPIQAQSRQQMGQMEISQIVTFQTESVTVIRRQGGQEQKKTLPFPRVVTNGSQTDSRRIWLTPAAAQRFVEKQLASGAQEIQFWSLDPTLGLELVETHLRIRGHQEIDILGKSVPTILCDAVVTKLPGFTARQYLDQQGQIVKSTLAIIPGLTLSIVESEPQIATGQTTGPELLASTLIRPDQPITQPRRLRSAVYALTFTDPTDGDGPAVTPLPPSCGFQRVQRSVRSTSHVSVDLDQPVQGLQDPPTPSHLDSTMMLNVQDPVINRLVTVALRQTPPRAPAIDRAQALCRFVHRHIQTKDLSVGFATASEVARTGTGDCTEHAVLLAAVLRVVNIPSRTVSGLIYVDRFLNQQGVFAYHMWTQAWLPDEQHPIKGRWVDLDATLKDAHFDAGHIALTTNDMLDASVTVELAAMMPIIGRLKIKVLDTKISPRPLTGIR